MCHLAEREKNTKITSVKYSPAVRFIAPLAPNEAISASMLGTLAFLPCYWHGQTEVGRASVGKHHFIPTSGMIMIE